MSGTSAHQAVNVADKPARFDQHWSLRTVATFNGHDVMVVEVRGDFVWHHHDDTDDVFLVLSGRLTIRLRDGDVTLGPGELFVVPVGVEHQPCASGGIGPRCVSRSNVLQVAHDFGRCPRTAAAGE